MKDQKLMSYEKEIQQLSKTCRELTDITEKNFQLNTVLTKKNSTLKSKLKKSNNECSTEKHKLKVLSNEKEDLKTQIDSKKEENGMLLSETNMLKDCINELKGFNDIKEENVNEVKKEKNQILIENKDLKSKNMKLNEEINKLAHSNGEMTKVNSFMKEILSGVKQRKDFTEQKLKGIMDKYKSFKSDILALQETVSALSQLRDSLQSENNELMHKLEDSESKENEMTRTIASIKNKMSILYEKNELSKKEISDLSKALDDQGLFVSTQKSKIALMSGEQRVLMDQSVKTIQELNNRHQEDQKEKAKLIESLEERSTIITNLKTQLDRVTLLSNEKRNRQNGEIENLFSCMKEILVEKDNFSSFLDSHIMQLSDQKKLIEQMAFNQEEKNIEAIGLLLAKNENIQMDNRKLVEKLKASEIKSLEKLDIFQANKASLRSQFDDLVESNKRYKDENTVLSQQLEKYVNDISNLRKENSNMEEDKNVISKENELLYNDIKRLLHDAPSQECHTEKLTVHGNSEVVTEGGVRMDITLSKKMSVECYATKVLETVCEEIGSTNVRLTSLQKVFASDESELHTEVIVLKRKIQRTFENVIDSECDTKGRNDTKAFKIMLANYALLLECLQNSEDIALLQGFISEKGKIVAALTNENETFKIENVSLENTVFLLKQKLCEYEIALENMREKQNTLQSYNVCLKETVSKHKGIVARLKEISTREVVLKDEKLNLMKMRAIREQRQGSSDLL